MSIINKKVRLKADHSRVGIVKSIERVTSDLVVEGFGFLVSLEDVEVLVEKNFVLGFLFNAKLDKVVLIKKNRPDYQAGKLNGLGGKIEQEDCPKLKMVDKFVEEAGVIVNDWKDCGVLSDGKTYKVNIFGAKGNIEAVNTMTSEEVCVYSVKDLTSLKCVYGVPMFVREAIDRLLKVS